MDRNKKQAPRRQYFKTAKQMIEAYEDAKKEIETYYAENPIQDYEKIWDVLHNKQVAHYKKVRFEDTSMRIQRRLRYDINGKLFKKSLKTDNIIPIIARDGTVKLDNWHAFYLHPLQTFKEFDRRNEYLAHFSFWFINKTFINYQKVYDTLRSRFCSNNYKKAREIQKQLKRTTSNEEEETLYRKMDELMVKINEELDRLLYKYNLKRGELVVELPRNPRKICGLYVAKWDSYDNYKANLDGKMFKEDTSLFERPMTLKQYMEDKGF